MTVQAVVLASGDLDTAGFADWLRGLLGPLFLVTVSGIGLVFLFTREVTRFVQFMAVAIAIAVIFYFPGVIKVLATGVARALGVSG